MKYLIALSVCICLIISACKTDQKPSSITNTNATQTATDKNDGPSFTIVDKSRSSIKVVDADTIDINTIEDIVANANHNTALRLKKGSYKLNKNLVYYISNNKKEIIDKKKVETRSIGGQIYVSDMTNFSIIGNDSDILSDNPKAIPLYIIKGEQGEIKDLTLGHSSVKTPSTVPSLYIARSNRMNFDNCNLGQQSKIGIKIQDSKLLTFSNCNIKDSHQKIVEIIKGKSIKFINSTFTNNICSRGCFDFLGLENSVEFKNVVVKNNRSAGVKANGPKQLITGISNNVRFRNSKFQGNKNFDEIGIDEFNLTECEVQKF